MKRPRAGDIEDTVNRPSVGCRPVTVIRPRGRSAVSESILLFRPNTPDNRLASRPNDLANRPAWYREPAQGKPGSAAHRDSTQAAPVTPTTLVPHPGPRRHRHPTQGTHRPDVIRPTGVGHKGARSQPNPARNFLSNQIKLIKSPELPGRFVFGAEGA